MCDVVDHLLYIGSKEKNHTRKTGPRMGFFVFEKAPAGFL